MFYHRLHEYTRRTTGPFCENMTSSTKPEIHNVSQSHEQSARNLVKFGRVCYYELGERTDERTGRRRSVACSILCQFLVCSCPLRRPVIERNVLRTMSWLLITITDIDEMDSSTFASSTLIFGADFFSYQIASGTKESAPISGVCVLSLRTFRLYSSVGSGDVLRRLIFNLHERRVCGRRWRETGAL